MKKYTLYGVLFTLFLILFVSIIILFFRYGEITAMPEFVKEAVNKINTPKQENLKEQTWQDKLSQLPQKDYVPAVQYFSMHFDIDTSAFEPKQQYFQISINKNDVYSMFCLKQTLNLFKIQYTLVSNKKSTQIILDTNDKNILENIVKKLKTYNINTQTKEIWL